MPVTRASILMIGIHLAVFSSLDLAVSSDQKPAEIIDKKLVAFCQSALLRDRGLTSTPFAGPSERWILERLLPDKRFLSSVDLSSDTSEYSGDLVFAPIPGEGRSNARERKEFGEMLASKLNNSRRKRLPGVYLRLEGLKALCRHEFAKLFDDEKSQRSIAKLADEMFQEQAAPLHRAIFTGPTDKDDDILILVQLRKISVELDVQILGMLNKAERERLARVISQSRALDDVVFSPGIR